MIPLIVLQGAWGQLGVPQNLTNYKIIMISHVKHGVKTSELCEMYISQQTEVFMIRYSYI